MAKVNDIEIVPKAGDRAMLQRILVLLATIGPGVLGLVADNDAGGMMSYLLTGAYGHLAIYGLALLVLAPITFFVQGLAMRIGYATQKPYAAVLKDCYSSRFAKSIAVALHLLNLLVLVTEFAGMAGSLSLLHIPLPLGVLMSFVLVSGLTFYKRYRSVEKLLLIIAVFNLVFIPALFVVHPHVTPFYHIFLGSVSPNAFFLLLALAGNAIAPWMIYWQQNAVVAGGMRSLSEGYKDIRLGIFAQVLMASVVMLTGALAANGHWPSLANPFLWLKAQGSSTTAILFAVGIFDAGFLAANTISFSSSWMLHEAFSLQQEHRLDQLIYGHTRVLHLLSLAIAALIVLTPNFSLGSISLWAQAAGGLFMPLSLFLLGRIASDFGLMGIFVLNKYERYLLRFTIGLYTLVGILGLWL